VRNLRLISLYTVHYFLHFCFHENVFTITPNALITPASVCLFRDKRGSGRKKTIIRPPPASGRLGWGTGAGLLRPPARSSGSAAARNSGNNPASAVYWTEDRGAML